MKIFLKSAWLNRGANLLHTDNFIEKNRMVLIRISFIRIQIQARGFRRMFDCSFLYVKNVFSRRKHVFESGSVPQEKGGQLGFAFFLHKYS